MTESRLDEKTMGEIENRVIVRHLEYTDLPALEWEGEYSHFRLVYANAYRRGVNGLSVNWVAELLGYGIVGQVFVQLICDRPELADGKVRAYLYSFRVRQQYRSQGIGSLILRTVEQDLLKRKYQIITLNVAKENTRAQKFYISHGFKIVAHEPGIWAYQDQYGKWRNMNEPAWRMEKMIYPENPESFSAIGSMV